MLIPFAPAPGLNSDDTTFAAEGRWADGNNVRFYQGRPVAVSRSTGGSPLPETTSPCRTIFAFDRGGTATAAFGLTNSLYIGTSIINNPAPSIRLAFGGNMASRGWAFATWGDTLLATPIQAPGGTTNSTSIYEQSGSSSATEIAQAPDAVTYMIVTNERQVLALGCNEESSGIFNSRCIRGCDIEDYTDWTTSSTNNAFEHILDDSGAIVAGTNLGAYVVVWTTTSLWLGQFLGDPSQTYRFEKVASNCGLIGGQAFTVIDGTAYWVGPDMKIRRWSPGAPPEILSSTISTDFEVNFTPNSGAYTGLMIMGTNTKRQEIWISYRDKRDISTSENSRYIAFSYETGHWFRGMDTIRAWCGSPLAAQIASDNLANIIVAKSGNAIHKHDHAGEGVAAGYIQSADFYIDSSQRRMMIRSLIPDFEEQVASVNLTVFVRNRPMDSATTKGPYTITTSTKKKDFRASGKIIAVKLSWSQTSGTSGLRIGKLLFDVVPMGER